MEDSKFFYSHLVNIEELIIELDSLDFSEKEKKELAQFLDSSLHHTILDAVLSELSDEDKMVFVAHLNENNKEKLWEFLNSRVEEVEDKIKKTAEELKKELRKDLMTAKSIHKRQKESKK